MSKISCLINSKPSWAPLALRIPLGITMMAHGSQKLFGWFGGGGITGTGKFMASLGLNPPELMAVMAGCGELVGGLFVLLGLLTRPSAFVLAFTMLVAIFAVHIDKGFFASQGGYEFALALLAMSVSLIISGAGRLSVDRVINHD